MNKDSVVEDIDFVKSILPKHYEVSESNNKGSIHCRSSIGIRKPPYINRVREQPKEGVLVFSYRNILVTDHEDEERWLCLFKAIKQHFEDRFREVYHNTCFCHVDFTIYLKQKK